MEQIIHATDTNFEGQEAMRQFILNRTLSSVTMTNMQTASPSRF